MNTQFNLLGRSERTTIDDFSLCNIKVGSGWIGIHPTIENHGLYYYLYSGTPKIGVAFESTLIELKENTLVSTKEYLDKSLLIETTDNCHLLIFNAVDKTQGWNGSLVTDTFTCDSDNSYLICIDGTPIVNGKTLQKFDYDKLTKGNNYSVSLDGGVLGLFTKVD